MMHPYKIKSAEKVINGEPLEGYAVYRNGERVGFVNVFDLRHFQDFINHINNAFDMLEMNNETR